MPRSTELDAFALAIRKRRKEMGFTQRELALAAGISPKSLCNVEMGNNWPSVPVYLALVDKLEPQARVPFLS